MRAQRADWAELVTREPRIAVASLNELVDRLIGWGLLTEDGDDSSWSSRCRTRWTCCR